MSEERDNSLDDSLDYSLDGGSLERSDDPILDVCLEELLGGVGPPDLSSRILKAHAERSARGPIAPMPIAMSRADAETRRAAVESSRRGGNWLPLTLAASVLVVAGGIWAMRRGSRPELAHDPQAADAAREVARVPSAEQVAHDPERRDGATSEEPDVESSDTRPKISETATTQSERAPQPDSQQAETQSVRHETTPGETSTDPGKLPDAPPQPEAPPSQPANPPAFADSPPSSPSAVSAAEVIAFIDESIRQRWRESGIRPSPAATDAEWCRRVFLDIVGRIPSVDELESYVADRSRDKRVRLVERLLDSDEYVEAYARNWTTIWTNTLVGRSGGTMPGSLVNREGLQQYLRRSLLTNKPYDRMVYELLSADGANTPGADGFNGAVNFLLDNLQENATTATAKTAQIFLGLQIQCTQCHNHPFNKWQQNRFWELNAFFRQTRAVSEMRGNSAGGNGQLVRLENVDFAGEGATPHPEEAEIYYELRNGIMQVAYPVFIDGTELNPSGRVSEVNRRDELAKLVIHSEYLGQAIVNRLWGHFFGYGFTKPLDDLGPHNPPSHPELLERLGREVAGHGYDLKELIRWITLSEAYGLSSKFGPKQGNISDDPTLGNPPLFSHFYLRQMSAEQLYDSLLVATNAHKTRGNFEEQQRSKDEWLKQFVIAFGTDDNGEASTFDGTITQTLMMMNGELTRHATTPKPGSLLEQVMRETDRGTSHLNHLYLAALSRRPSRGEVQLASGLLSSRGGDATTVLEDVWWALLNSNEFILNH